MSDVKQITIEGSTGGKAMTPYSAGADMAMSIFKGVTEQDSMHNATELIVGLVSGGVGILKVSLGPDETRKVLDALKQSLAAEPSQRPEVH